MNKVEEFIKNVKPQVAIFVQVMPAGTFTGHAELYKTYGGPLPEYVVVSSVNVPSSGPETFIFESNESGVVTNWRDLEGSFNGDLDIPRALKNTGYEVVGRES